MEPFFAVIDDDVLKREREAARKLRSTQWWKRRRSSGRCHYCKAAVPPRELTMDHVIPLARGGRTEKFNVVPCCKSCNTRKKQLLPAEWETYMTSIKK